MSRKKKRSKRYVPPSVEARMQRKQAEVEAVSTRRRWLIAGAVAVLVIAAVILWFTVGPGKPVPPTPTPTLGPAPTLRYSAPPEMQIDPEKAYYATISTSKGDIVAMLYADKAPMTVNNFVFLARDGFYDGLIFHRVEPGFVIQGGDPLGTGGGGPGYTVPAEIGLPHTEGALAMARQSDAVNPERASSGSQFYITLAPTPQLDGAYTVFGQVIEGMDVVLSIEIGDVIESISITEE